MLMIRPVILTANDEVFMLKLREQSEKRRLQSVGGHMETKEHEGFRENAKKPGQDAAAAAATQTQVSLASCGHFISSRDVGRVEGVTGCQNTPSAEV